MVCRAHAFLLFCKTRVQAEKRLTALSLRAVFSRPSLPGKARPLLTPEGAVLSSGSGKGTLRRALGFTLTPSLGCTLGHV